MKKIIFTSTVVMALVGVPFILQAAEDEGTFSISEIMYDPAGSDSNKEWIEVSVNRLVLIPASGKYKEQFILPLKICDKYDNVSHQCSEEHPIYSMEEELVLETGQIIITQDRETFHEIYPSYEGVLLESNFTLSNSETTSFVGLDIVGSIDGETDGLADMVPYSSSWGGNGNDRTIEKIDLAGENQLSNWKEAAQEGGTPGQLYEKVEIFYPDTIVINEIAPDPPTGGLEWIELFNRGQEDISLQGWVVQDRSGKSYTFPPVTISADGFLTLDGQTSKISLNNDGDQISLHSPDGEIKDDQSYPAVQEESWSWSRNESGEYLWTTLATPGGPNHFPSVASQVDGVILNEVLSNPSGRDSDSEWIELANTNNFAVNINGWYFLNKSKKKFEIEGLSIAAEGLVAVPLVGSSFSLANNLENIKLFNSAGLEADAVAIDSVAPEGASLNRDPDGRWRWSPHLTPGKKNRFNQLPSVKIKNKMEGHLSVPLLFDASKVKDSDNDQLKFIWEFGDGQKSFLSQVKHTFQEVGEYDVQLTVSDGIESVIKKVTVKISRHPHYRLKITRLIANPVGSDLNGKEIVEVKNEEKKKVCLDGYSIGSGSDPSRLVKHKLEKICINRGEKRSIDNQECKFTLVNAAGAVALFYPDGEKADQVEYRSNHNQEGAEYFLEKGLWNWKSLAVPLPVEKESMKPVPVEKGSIDQQTSQTTENDAVRAPADEAAHHYDHLLKQVFESERREQCLVMECLEVENWLLKNQPMLQWLPLQVGLSKKSASNQ